MAKFRNVSPLGALFIFDQTVEAGQVFEVTDQQAVYLEGQDENFEPVADAPSSISKTEPKGATHDDAA